MRVIAIDPGLFREREEFAADVTRFCTDLRATTPVDPDQPVMVAGDPQWNNAATRMRDGIPVGAGLLNQVRQIAQAWAICCTWFSKPAPTGIPSRIRVAALFHCGSPATMTG